MNIPKNFWNLSIAAVALLAIFLLALSIKTFKEVGYIGVNPNQDQYHQCRCTGDAYLSLMSPLSHSQSTDTEKVVADAQKKATDKVNAALAVVRVAGVATRISRPSPTASTLTMISDRSLSADRLQRRCSDLLSLQARMF